MMQSESSNPTLIIMNSENGTLYHVDSNLSSHYNCSPHNYTDNPPLYFNITEGGLTIKQPGYLLVLYVVAYSIIFMTALVGNTMVVAVVALRPGMRSVTNVFIANLAVADMLVAILCIPITLMDNIYLGWPFGEFLCKFTPYVQGVSVCATVYNLAAIAVDRYLAICFKPQFRIMRRGACLILVGIWLFSFILILPWLINYKLFTCHLEGQQLKVCQAMFPTFQEERTYYVVAILFGTYILPLTVVLLCYILVARRVWHRRAPGVASSCNIIRRYRIKVMKMLITVVAVFALSWLPLHTIYFLIYFVFPRDTQIHTLVSDILVPLAQWLELSNSGMNAIIYCFFSENFRHGFRDLLRCVLGRRHINFKRGISSAIPQRRIGRSLSEESTVVANCTVQQTQALCKRKPTRDFLHMDALKKRYVWKTESHNRAHDSTVSSNTTSNNTSTSLILTQSIEENPHNLCHHNLSGAMELSQLNEEYGVNKTDTLNDRWCCSFAD